MKKIFYICAALVGLTACEPTYDEGSILVSSPVTPVLLGVDKNPLINFIINDSDPKEKLELNRIVLSFEGTDRLSDIAQVAVYAKNASGQGTDSLIAATTTIDAKLKLSSNYKQEAPQTQFCVSVLMKEHIDLERRLAVQLLGVKTNKGKVVAPKLPINHLRYAVPVHQHMMDGVHSARIPGLEITNSGVLMAVYDARWDGSRDLQGNMDIAMKRSTDGGILWKPMHRVLDMKEWGGLPEKFNGVSDANILVDRNTGQVFVFGLWMHGVIDPATGKWVEGLTEESDNWNHQWAQNGSKPGTSVKESPQLLMTVSDDEGLSWSEPRNLTASLKHKDWSLYAPAPGHGITLADGTLVVPTQGRDLNGLPFSNIMWSKDHGKTWTSSNPAKDDTTECMAVELSDGGIMLNMRDNRNNYEKDKVNGRSVAVTYDLGQTWTEHPTSRKALIEPVCMGSIHRHNYTENGEQKSVLLFMNPNSKTDRNNISIKVSFDDGNTWPSENTLLLEEKTGWGYSCITSIDEETIGVLYEGNQADMTFQRIPFKELIDPSSRR